MIVNIGPVAAGRLKELLTAIDAGQRLDPITVDALRQVVSQTTFILTQSLRQATESLRRAIEEASVTADSFPADTEGIEELRSLIPAPVEEQPVEEQPVPAEEQPPVEEPL